MSANTGQPVSALNGPSSNGKLTNPRLNSIITAGGMLLQQVLGFVGGVFVAKLLGPADYGEVSVLRSLLALVIVFTPLGLDLALFRILPRYDQSPHDQALHFRRFRLIVAIAGIGMALIGGLMAGPLLSTHVYHFHGFAVDFAITLCAVPFATDILLLTAWYRVQGNIIPILLITSYFQPVVRTVLNVLAVYLGFGVIGVVVGTTVAYLAAFLIASLYFAWTRRSYPPRELDSSPPAWSNSWHQFLEAPPMALNLFAYNIMRTADLTIVGAIVAARAVGEYAVVSNIAQLVPVAATSLMQTLGPAIARHHRAGNNQSIAKDINHTIWWASLLASFVFGGIAGFGGHLDTVFGSAYHPNSGIIVLIPLGYLMSATLSPTSYALTMCGHSRIDLIILLVSAVLLVGLCIPLTSEFGTVGAAIAVLISFTIVNVLRLVAVRRILQIRLGHWRDIVPPLVALILGIVCNYLLVPEHTKLPRLIAGCTVYGLIYGAVMFGRPVLVRLKQRASVRPMLGEV